MKNLFLFTLLSVSLISNIDAQEEDTNSSFIDKLTFGVKAGPTISTSGSGNVANNNQKDGARTQISFHIGAVAELKLTKNLSFQTELLYSSEKSQTIKKDENYEASYIQVPLLLKYYITKNLSIEAGPQIGFLLSSSIKTSSINTPVTGDLKSTDFRFTGGLSYRLKNGFNFGGRYDIYLTDPINEDFTENFVLPYSKFRNGLIYAFIGYSF